MSLERVFRGIVGGLVLSGIGLTLFHHPNWLYFLGLVGFMLLQSSVTDKCPLIWLLERFGMKECRRSPVGISTKESIAH
jgi:hypothetical protein